MICYGSYLAIVIYFVTSYALIMQNSYKFARSPVDLQIIDSLQVGFLSDVTLESRKVCPETYGMLLEFEETCLCGKRLEGKGFLGWKRANKDNTCPENSFKCSDKTSADNTVCIELT